MLLFGHSGPAAAGGFYFSDPAVERRFQLYHGGVGVILDIGPALLGIFGHLLAIIRARFFAAPAHAARTLAATATAAAASAAHQSTAPATDAAAAIAAQVATAQDTLWLRTIKLLTIPLLYLVLGWERYILVRGPFSVCHRLMLAVGLGIYTRPSSSSWWQSTLFRHRLLPINAACTVSRIPCEWYWIGSLVCWIAAVLLDAADPDGTCGQSLTCVGSVLQRLFSSAAATAAESPVLQAKQALAALLCSSSIARIADIMLPGLLLTYWERKARRAWAAMQQQHMQQQHQRSATAASVAIMPGATGLIAQTQHAAATGGEAAPDTGYAGCGSGSGTAMPVRMQQQHCVSMKEFQQQQEEQQQEHEAMLTSSKGALHDECESKLALGTPTNAATPFAAAAVTEAVVDTQAALGVRVSDEAANTSFLPSFHALTGVAVAVASPETPPAASVPATLAAAAAAVAEDLHSTPPAQPALPSSHLPDQVQPCVLGANTTAAAAPAAAARTPAVEGGTPAVPEKVAEGAKGTVRPAQSAAARAGTCPASLIQVSPWAASPASSLDDAQWSAVSAPTLAATASHNNNVALVRRLPVTSLSEAAAVLPTAAAAVLPSQGASCAAVAGDLARVQRRLQGSSSLYRSPLETVQASFKLSHPPYASALDYDRIQQQFTEVLQSHINQVAAVTYSTGGSTATGISCSSNSSSSIGSSNTFEGPPVALVTQCTAFAGCYQLVFQAVVGISAEDRAAGRRQLQLQLQHAAQLVLQAWPDWSLLHARQLPPIAEAEPTAAEATAAGLGTGASAGAAQGSTQVDVIELLGDLEIYLQPVALPMLDQRSVSYLGHRHKDSSSGSGTEESPPGAASNTACPPAATVELCLSQPCMARLMRRGNKQLRILVAQQPEGRVLRDQSWDLLQLLSSSGTFGDANESLSKAQPSPEAPPGAEALPAAAAAVRVLGMPSVRLQLLLDYSELRAHATNGGRRHTVLSVVVLAGEHNSDTEGQAPVESGESAGTAAAAAAAGPHGGGGHVAHDVVAQLPLLVLPASVQVELQELYQVAAARSSSDSEGYQELVPLLRDLALVLQCTGSRRSSSSTGHGNTAAVPIQQQPADSTTTASAQLCDVVFDALAACFVQHGMNESLRLLLTLQDQQEQRQQQQQQLHDSAATVDTGGDEEKAMGGRLSSARSSAAEHTLATVLEGLMQGR